MSHINEHAAAFSGLVDLAAERIGGKALAASDEFFADKDNLLKPGRGIFLPDKYTERGKWMDGWESRRKRFSPEEAAFAHDWCIIKLGLPGLIKGVDIDTHNFLGNSPAYASLDVCADAETASVNDLQKTLWTTILPKSPIKPGSQNLFSISHQSRCTHVRLNIYPDGGVARLRVYGIVVPDWSALATMDRVDLASVANGGFVLAASDMYFGNKENLIMPGRASSMAEGWETRRRRGPGHEWAIVRLGKPGSLSSVEVDTHHFKGNFPERCSVECCYAPDADVDELIWSRVCWVELLPSTALYADTQHRFEQELKPVERASHVRLNIYPDGGVSRLRVFGKPLL